MKFFFTIHFPIAWIVYIFLDFLCIGLGMGVPIFCIMLGFPTGWYIARRYSITGDKKGVMKKSFLAVLATTLVTFIFMVLIWGPPGIMIFDPQADFENFGHPYFLFDPYISFVGWIVLMIVISPFLQLLTTVFASYVTIMKAFR